jgi:hypothetical protein
VAARVHNGSKRGCVGVTQTAAAQCCLSVVWCRDAVEASGPPWSLSLGWFAKQAHRHARLCDAELTKDCKGGTGSKRACNKHGCAEKKDAPIHQRCCDFFKRARLGAERGPNGQSKRSVINDAVTLKRFVHTFPERAK